MLFDKLVFGVAETFSLMQFLVRYCSLRGGFIGLIGCISGSYKE